MFTNQPGIREFLCVLYVHTVEHTVDVLLYSQCNPGRHAYCFGRVVAQPITAAVL